MKRSSMIAAVASLGLCSVCGIASAQVTNPALTTVAYRQDNGVGHHIKEGFRDTTDALHITPNIKGAIIADRYLNNRRNHINVDTKDYVVRLRGHVYSQAMRHRASQIAARKLQKMHKRYRIDNELTVTG